MAVTDTLPIRADPAGDQPRLRILLLLIVLALGWWFAQLPLGTVVTSGIAIYATVNLGLLRVIRHSLHQPGQKIANMLLIISVLSDLLFTLYLLLYAGPLTLAIFPLYLILLLKALLYRHITLWMLLVPALIGPLNLAHLQLLSERSSFTLGSALAFWGLVGGTICCVGLLFFIAEQRLYKLKQMSVSFARARSDYLAHIHELESVDQDLRLRIRRQQALEESLRAITGTQSLDLVLIQLLDSLLQMLGVSRVGAAALTLAHGDQLSHYTLGETQPLIAQTEWAEHLAREVGLKRTPLIVSDTYDDQTWQPLQQVGVRSALSVPLTAPGGTMLGALSVVGLQRDLFSATEARYLTLFSIQASVAIHNAELHNSLLRQGRLLEAVLREMGDGLLVMNEQGALILANPLAYQALRHSREHGGRLRPLLNQLSQELCTQHQTMIRRELQVGEEQQQRHYLIYASRVRIVSERQSLIAFTLHDTTAQKRHAQQQVEFISMVSHELRSPLTTLNGFLKLVLQGKVGRLNATQEEFLGLAAEQADALKGRITELLEFNRLEAGQLRLHPRWADLAELVRSLATRFQPQAEQFGVAVTSELPLQLPELSVDDQRIDQVITNLVENALKATPPGGVITISAEVVADEVLVHVTDTGVGIPLDQQERIFNHFYQLEPQATQPSSHLGLGLAICRQIVEGHHGRIWVTSTVGQGSRFSFALPLIPKEPVDEDGTDCPARSGAVDRSTA